MEIPRYKGRSEIRRYGWTFVGEGVNSMLRDFSMLTIKEI